MYLDDFQCQVDQMRDIVYTFGMCLQGLIECMAMQAENKQREFLGESMAYTEEDFMTIIDKHMIHHNGLLSNMRRY